MTAAGSTARGARRRFPRAVGPAGLLLLASLPLRARAEAPGGKPEFAPPVPAPVAAPASAGELSAPAASPALAPAGGDVERRLRALEEQNTRLMQELKSLREDQTALRDDHQSVSERLQGLSSQVSGRITGYLDFGFFYVRQEALGGELPGNGSGLRTDDGNAAFPQYRGDVPDTWVFLGDPLSTAINSRGNPADTGDSRAVTFDSVHNRGTPSFIVNSLNIALFAGLGRSLTLNGVVDLIPRNRYVAVPLSGDRNSRLGDYPEVKLAYAEYTVPTDRFDLRISAGKIDPVLGIEYRIQESPDRIGVIPSLICRYTCGRPLGLKIRGRFFGGDLFVVALAVSNGSSFTELFPFGEEIDTNKFKTISARLSTKIPVGGGLEIGASGAFGAQDFQSDNNVYQWHYGVDLHLEVRDFDLRAEFVQGSADGKNQAAAGGSAEVECGTTACLKYKGAYGQASYRVLNWLIPYARVDWRDAFHRAGQSFVYISDLLRVTAGVRLELGEYVLLKAEYTYNRELGNIPQFANDVFTSSLVVKY